jgi:uncharacterized protein YegP (UPF0339 family)
MSERIEIIQGTTGWHVCLVAANNEKVFTSEVYETEQGAEYCREWIMKFDPVDTITKRMPPKMKQANKE